jgi:protein SCO1
MSSKAKAFVASLILLLPLATAAFLYLFADNQYGLKVLNPQSAECPAPTAPDTVHRVPGFALTSQQGSPITPAQLTGKVYVANFFFTRCPDICLQMSSELTRVQEMFQGRPEVHILSHTVDPGHDSVPVLQQYAARYGINPAQWTLATGSKAVIYDLARCGYFVSAKPATNDLKLDFIHSDKLVLVDKERRIRGFYSGTQREEVDRLITEIQVLLTEYK